MAIQYTPKLKAKRDLPPKPISPPPKKHAGGRPRKADAKIAISIRLDRDVLEKWKATGPGWQARINEALKRAAP